MWVRVSVLFIYIICISIICVSQEEPSLIASNQQITIEQFLKRKDIVESCHKGGCCEHIYYMDVSVYWPLSVLCVCVCDIRVPVKNHIMCQISVNARPFV